MSKKNAAQKQIIEDLMRLGSQGYSVRQMQLHLATILPRRYVPTVKVKNNLVKKINHKFRLTSLIFIQTIETKLTIKRPVKYNSKVSSTIKQHVIVCQICFLHVFQY
jgi:hypothetical protein